MSDKRYDNVVHSRKAIFFNNLIGGVGWGIGATIGLSIILAIFAFVVQQLHFIPGVGETASDLYKSVIDTAKQKD